MIRKILIAYDTSAPADKAFEFALEIAGKFAAELIVLAVARLPEPPEAVETEAMLERARQLYDRSFSGLLAKAAAAGVDPRCEVKVGHPAEQIVHLADLEQVDMIVMGHRGHSGVKRWLLGSVSKRVMSYAPCTVCIVR